jgi:cell division protein FtsI (penicillin-binding protein 3)
MDNKGYNKSNKIYQSSFIGYFPEDKPRYSIAVVIQNSSESKLAYGGVVSAPVFKEVADKIYAGNLSDQPLFNSPFVKDSINYNYYGLKNDINKIADALKIQTVDSAISGPWRAITMYNNNAVLRTTAEPSAKIPNVIGLGLKDAVYLLENFGLKVIASGKGRVIYQSLTSESDINKVQAIKIELN